MSQEPRNESSLNILVIDDESVICEGCRLVLSGEGHAVETRLTGSSGLEAIQENGFDLILLDMKLPDMEGMDVLRDLRRARPGTFIIVMTGYSTVENAVEAMKSGAFDYLAKPFTDDQLIIAVEKAREKMRLVNENIALRKELIDRFGFKNIVGENPRILRIFDQIQKVAPTDSTVLLYGESGTGKELFSRAIHAHSRRSAMQFIAVDCSTLSPNLLESELFGHVKGAFTGAVYDKEGIFEVAQGGTLFLDDVANLTAEIQGKLLRVLEAQEYKPVGASRIRKTDVRIIAATNKELRAMVADELFREDLFYRLNVVPIYLPPLRGRRDDIPRLAYHFLRHFCRKTGRRITGFSDNALEALVGHDWPGNVRQLKNVIERLVIMSDSATLGITDVLSAPQMIRFLKEDSIPDTHRELKAFKKQIIESDYGQVEMAFLKKALKASGGNISHAAKTVGMQRSNFSTLMKKHGLTARDFAEKG